MKKYKVLFFVLILFIVSGCKSIDQKIDDSREQVEKDMKEVSNINVDTIKRDLTYLEANLEKKQNENTLINKLNYLYLLGDITSNNNSEIKELADTYFDYLKDKKKYKNKVNSLLDDIKSNEDELAFKYYSNYVIYEILGPKINGYKEMNVDESEEEIIRGVNYIAANIEDPTKDNEVVDRISYYSVYLSKCEKDNIKTLGNNMIIYLTSLKAEDKSNVYKYLNEILLSYNLDLTY